MDVAKMPRHGTNIASSFLSDPPSLGSKKFGAVSVTSVSNIWGGGDSARTGYWA